MDNLAIDYNTYFSCRDLASVVEAVSKTFKNVEDYSDEAKHTFLNFWLVLALHRVDKTKHTRLKHALTEYAAITPLFDLDAAFSGQIRSFAKRDLL